MIVQLNKKVLIRKKVLIFLLIYIADTMDVKINAIKLLQHPSI